MIDKMNIQEFKLKNQIYKITNLVNNKIYIGLTTQEVWNRYLNHLSEARCGSKWPIHRAIRKYGKENFKLEILASLEENQDLYELEKYYIKMYNSSNRYIGYNLTKGGEGSSGIKRSEEFKNKISNTKKFQFANGLRKPSRRIEIKVTNIINNSVLIYESKKECIKNFKMTMDKLNSNIKNKKIHDNTYLFEKND